MRNFFNAFLIIVFITLLLMFFLDRSYTYIFENGEPRSKIQNMLQLKYKHYDVAFFGSSRTEQHVDCKLITELTGKSCINFGITSGSPGDMLILMKLAANREINFNQVLMQVDYNYNNIGISYNFKTNLIPFMGDPIVKEQLKIYNENFISRRIPFYGYMEFDRILGFRGFWGSFLKRKPNINFQIGYSPNHGEGKAVAGSFPETIKNISKELDQMQELYQDTGTSLEFFTAPYCKEVENRDFMKKVQLKLPGLHNYIDIFDDKDEYFFNCGHLNQVGARVFTKTLAEDLLK